MKLEQLYSSPGKEVYKWVEENLDKIADFNWLLLAEMSSSKAVFNEDGEFKKIIDTDWFKVGIKVYEFLSNQQSQKISTSLIYGAMINRVNLIINEHDNAVVSSELGRVECWFFNSLKFELKEILEIVDDFKKNIASLDIETLRELRDIKSKLVLLERLEESKKVEFYNRDLYEWISIKDKLP